MDEDRLLSLETDSSAVITLIYQINNKNSELRWQKTNLEDAHKRITKATQDIERTEYEIKNMMDAVATLRSLTPTA